MKKLLKYILLTVVALFMSVHGIMNSAEAAGIVVLPVINNVDYHDIESTFYDNVIDCIKQQNKYDYIDNDVIIKTLEKYTVKGQLPSESALRNIAEETDASIVMCIELNKLAYNPVRSRSDDMYLMDLKGFTVSYNRESNMFKKQKLHIEDELDNGFYTRQDVQLRYWARTVQHEMHRVMQVKGLNLQKPRLQKL